MRRRWSEVKSECSSLLSDAERALAEAARKEIRGGYILVYDSSRADKTPGKTYMRMNEILEALCGIRIQRSVYWFPSLETARKFRELFWPEARIFEIEREIR